MFATVTLQDWENLVKKQLKTDDIYAILSKENLEGITVKPYYDKSPENLKNLPKVEESTHLVAKYQEGLEEDAYAFLLNNNVEKLYDKTIFVANEDLAGHITLSEENRYFSLIDVFVNNEINSQLAEELLSKNFERNICVDASLYQNAGASITQQLTFSLGKAKDLAEVFGAEILNKLVFKFAIGANYFFEIAKIRAFKMLFNQFSKEFNLDLIPYIFAETSLRNKAKNDEENNLIRSTLEIAATMIAGSDAVFANDFKVQNSTELSEEISFKQQVVLAYESIINVFEDAANGSYYVEEITHQLAENAWKLFLELENSGGFVENLKSGKIAEIIYNQAIAEQNWVEEGKIKLIGVNLYPKLEKTKSVEQLYNAKEIKAVRLAEMFE
ncbi:MAG: methylmalonyl-CoA mutase [Cloacibacterium sp.]|nr:methylmalonyl-CoA mutase [Cloacibacterium sp.]